MRQWNCEDRLDRVRAALRDSEERFRDLADSIGDVFFALDRHLNCTYWNKAAERLSGISAEGAAGRQLFELLPGLRRGPEASAYAEAVRTGRPRRFVQSHRVAGHEAHLEVNLYPNRRGLAVYAVDVTRRVLAERKLAESEELYRLHFENASDVVFMLDRRMRIVSLSPSAEKIFGYPAAEVVGKNVAKLAAVRPESLPAALKNIGRLLKGETVEPTEYRVVSVSGERRVVEISGGPVRSDGRVVGVVGVARDVTERKRAERELSAREKKYRQLFRAMSEGCALHRVEESRLGRPTDYVILDVNPAYTAITGIPARRAVGARASKLYGQNPPPNLTTFARVARTGRPATLVERFADERTYEVAVFCPAPGQFATVFHVLPARG